MIKISVIVPVYNVEEYLEKCLDSLINQTFKEFEIIVVNDGSPDNSQKIIDKFEKEYPKLVKGYQKKNGGLSSARNYGLTKAKGEYVAFVDSDDYVSEDYLEAMYNKIIEDNSDMVICDIIKTNTKEEEIIPGVYNYKIKDIKKKVLLSMPAAWNKLYKKNLFIDNNIEYPEGIYYEDLATTGRLLLHTKKISYVNKGLYYYLVREGSITRQKKYNPKTADMFTSLEILKKYYKEKNKYENYKEEIEYLYINNLLHAYIITIFKYDESIECVNKVHNLIKKEFKHWKKNKYFKNRELKYKIVCKLIYKKQIKLLRLLLK